MEESAHAWEAGRTGVIALSFTCCVTSSRGIPSLGLSFLFCEVEVSDASSLQCFGEEGGEKRSIVGCLAPSSWSRTVTSSPWQHESPASEHGAPGPPAAPIIWGDPALWFSHVSLSFLPGLQVRMGSVPGSQGDCFIQSLRPSPPPLPGREPEAWLR